MKAIHQAFAARRVNVLGFLKVDGFNQTGAPMAVEVDFSESVKRVALFVREREGLERGATVALTFDDAEELRSLLAAAIEAGKQFHGMQS